MHNRLLKLEVANCDLKFIDHYLNIKFYRPPKGCFMPLNDWGFFIPNQCSQLAKKIQLVVEKSTFEIWFDKHYHNRQLFGDDFGERTGIETSRVLDLVIRSLRHLLFYSATIRGFKMINYSAQPDPTIRVLLQEEVEDTILNVVIEAHTTVLNVYEITVKTAMCVENFRVALGQYIIEVEGIYSKLKRNDNQKIVTLSTN